MTMSTLQHKVPEGWERTALRNVAAQKPFAIVDGPFGTQLHADEYTMEGIPLVRISNLSYEGRFDASEMKRVSEAHANRLRRSTVGPGDLIIAKTGATIGKAALFPGDLTKGLIASSCLKVSFDRTKADPRLFLYLIISPQGQNSIIEGAGGSTRTTINIRPFGAIEFSFPKSVAEQSKIADVLLAVDQAIEIVEASIAKLNRIKQGLMHDLLTRGIDENGVVRSEKTHRFKSSPLGRIPEEWNVVELETLKKAITSGSRAWAAYYSDDGPLFMRIGNLTRDHINLRLDDLMHVNPPASSEGSRTRIDEGDVLISITADLGIIGVAPDDLGEAYVNQHIALVKLDRSKANPRWIGYFLANEQGQKQFYRLNDPGAKAGLNLPTVGRLLVLLPPAREQEKIVAVADAHVSGIHAEEAYRDKLKHLKRGLMEDLLAGRVRVNHLLKQ
jgi:type I restriction enzyme, S subunit